MLVALDMLKDLYSDKRKINEKRFKMSLNTMDRMKFCIKIVKDLENIYLFFGLEGNDKQVFVQMLL